MAEREIKRVLRLNGEVYKPGEEDKLLKKATPEQIQAMKERKLIRGKWSPEKATKEGGKADGGKPNEGKQE